MLPLVQTLLRRLGAECDEFFTSYLAASLADDCQDPAELLAGGVDEQLAAICPGVAAEERQVLLLETIEQVCITTNVLSVGFSLALHGGQSCKLQLSNTSQPWDCRCNVQKRRPNSNVSASALSHWHHSSNSSSSRHQRAPAGRAATWALGQVSSRVTCTLTSCWRSAQQKFPGHSSHTCCSEASKGISR